MRLNLTHAAAVATTVALMTPMIASAQSVGDIQNQIQGLMNQIKALQQQLLALRASSTPPVPQWKDANATSTHPMPPKPKVCLNLMRNIRHGDRGDDIRQLQDMLREDGRFGFTANSTGFFGPMTAQAVAKWQMHNGIASTTDGSVGPKTRAFFKDCGVGNQGGTMGPSAFRNLGDKIRDFFGIGDEDRRDVVVGKVASVSGQSFTVERANGGTRTVTINASTTIKVKTASSSAPIAGSMADIVVDKLVKAEGTANNDSLVAHTVFVGISANEHWGKPPMPPMPPVPPHAPGNSGTNSGTN